MPKELRIQQAINEIIKPIDYSSFDSFTVSGTDLCCSLVLQVGTEFEYDWEAIVEGVTDDDLQLAEYIETRLIEQGYPSVRVLTNW